MTTPFLFSLLLATAAAETADTTEEAEALAPITVRAERIANIQPASSFEAAATALRFDPQVDLQSRGLPEGQADVTVRGGLFENTGFRLGAVPVFDPQTGHYSVEIPFDPAMLSRPELMLDLDNGVNAFNASVATVAYGFSRVRSGGGLSLGAGSDNLRYGVLRGGREWSTQSGRRAGAAISAAGSRGDGSAPYGDHDFKRFSGQFQLSDENGETNLLLGYHDKFFGWPGAYTGFASLPETDHTKLGLALANHRRHSSQGWWEVGAAYRWLENDYDFDRRTQESGTPGSFEHETRSFTTGLTGMALAAGWEWHLSAVLAADRLVRSTDLTHGDFNSRRYFSLSLAPSREWTLTSGNRIRLQAGVRWEDSNRDESAWLPLASLSLEGEGFGGSNRLSLSWSQTSQLPGYTALNSRPTGLFGGNPDLGREYADTLTFGLSHRRPSWWAEASVFQRRDDDLVDWTFRAGAPFLRQANPVDIDVLGAEVFLAWQSRRLEVTVGFTWLDKEADYGSAEVDASFYALNFARRRATLAVIAHPAPTLDIRWDNEFRRQQENPLRNSKDTAWLTSLSLNWRPDAVQGLRLSLVADNLGDDDFEEFPGTPAARRQYSLGMGYEW